MAVFDLTTKKVKVIKLKGNDVTADSPGDPAWSPNSKQIAVSGELGPYIAHVNDWKTEYYGNVINGESEGQSSFISWVGNGCFLFIKYKLGPDQSTNSVTGDIHLMDTKTKKIQSAEPVIPGELSHVVNMQATSRYVLITREKETELYDVTTRKLLWKKQRADYQLIQSSYLITPDCQ